MIEGAPFVGELCRMIANFVVGLAAVEFVAREILFKIFACFTVLIGLAVFLGVGAFFVCCHSMASVSFFFGEGDFFRGDDRVGAGVSFTILLFATFFGGIICRTTCC